MHTHTAFLFLLYDGMTRNVAESPEMHSKAVYHFQNENQAWLIAKKVFRRDQDVLLIAFFMSFLVVMFISLCLMRIKRTSHLYAPFAAHLRKS